MTRAKKAEAMKYGEAKRPYQFYLTESTSKQIEVTATKLNLSRSEVLEQYIRGVIN